METDNSEFQVQFERIVENAFTFYRKKLFEQVKIEQNGSSNQIIVAQINLIIQSLDSAQNNLKLDLPNLYNPNLKGPSDKNLILFRSILNQYSRDLDRGIVLLENEFEYYLKDHDLLKDEIEMVNRFLDLIKKRNQRKEG